MSYSFSVMAANKDEAGQKVADALANVVNAQPVHAVDRQAAQDAAEAFINKLVEPGENEQLVVNVNGSMGWRSEGEFTHASVGVQAYIQPVPKE